MIRILIIFSFFISTSLFATHNRGGEITYKKISEFTYEIKVTTYTYTLGAADRPELEMDFGDNSPIYYIQRVSEVILPNFYKVNVYKGTHTFPSYGNYIISMSDPNRNEGVANIPNPLYVPLYIESLLRVDQNINNSETTEFGTLPIFIAQSGTVFKHNVTTYNLNGDLLTYELVPCKGHNGEDILGYTFPQNMSVHPLTGEITWNTANSIGIWNIAVRINRWQSNVKVGYTIRDMQIDVVSGIYPQASFLGCNNWTVDNYGAYRFLVDTNETLDLSFEYKNINATNLSLETVSEVYLISDSAVFEAIQTDSVTISGEFSWSPNSSSSRIAPYIVTFRGTSFTSNNFANDLTIAIYVGDTIPQLSTPEKFVLNDGVEIYPNPIAESAIINLDYDTQIYKKLNLSIYNLRGNLVWNKKDIKNKSITFHRNGLESGMYLYVLESESNAIAIGKIILQ